MCKINVLGFFFLRNIDTYVMVNGLVNITKDSNMDNALRHVVTVTAVRAPYCLTNVNTAMLPT